MQPQYAMAPHISDPSKVVWTAWVGVNNKDHLESLRLGKCTKPHVVLRVSPSKAHVEKIIATAEKFLRASKSKMPIETDVVYQDDNICILKPTSTRGIVVRTHIPANLCAQIWSDGLKSAKKMYNDKGIVPRVGFLWDNVFFRAPFHELNYDGPTDEDLLDPIYDHNYEQAYDAYDKAPDTQNFIYIRIDPDHSFVYSSEIVHQIYNHTYPEKYPHWNERWQDETKKEYTDEYKKWVIERRNESKRLCSEYMQLIAGNKTRIEQKTEKYEAKNRKKGIHWIPAWNLLDGRVDFFKKESDQIAETIPIPGYWDRNDISEWSELLAPSYVDPDWFVRFDCVEY